MEARARRRKRIKRCRGPNVVRFTDAQFRALGHVVGNLCAGTPFVTPHKRTLMAIFAEFAACYVERQRALRAI